MMTSGIGSVITNKVMNRITGPAGLNAGLAALTLGGPDAAQVVDPAQVRAQNVAAEMAERSGAVKYPSVNVYCEGLANDLREKFRSFSGKAEMAIEVRHSQDRLEGLEQKLEFYVDGAMQLLNESRGDWGDGMFYGGKYQVSFSPVKQGGKNFMQIAKITFEIGVSRN
jgi:hypothetical protein